MTIQTDYRRWDAVDMARLVRDREVTAAELEETARALAERYAARMPSPTPPTPSDRWPTAR